MELSVQEAAEQLGVSEATIRRRIRKGALRAIKRSIPTGYEWRVIVTDQPAVTINDQGVTAANQGVVTTHYLDQPEKSHNSGVSLTYDQLAVTVDDQGVTSTDQGLTTVDAVPLAAFDHVINDNRRLQEQNTQLAGQVGFLQAKLQDAQEQIRLLTAQPEPIKQPPEESELEPQSEKPEHKEDLPWWERLRRRLRG